MRMPWSPCGTSLKPCLTTCTNPLPLWRLILVNEPRHCAPVCHLVPYRWRSSTQVEAKSCRGSCRASILAVQVGSNAASGAEKHSGRAFRHRSYRNVRAERELLCRTYLNLMLI